MQLRDNRWKRFSFARIHPVCDPYSIRIASVHTFARFPGVSAGQCLALRQVTSTRPARAVEALLGWHGFWPVARALLPQALRRRVPADTGDERRSDHMRRDIGLWPVGFGSPSVPRHLRKPV